MRDNFKPTIFFPAVKQGVNAEIGSRRKITCLNEIDDRKLLVVSVSQTSDEMILCNVVYDLTISNPSLKRYLQMRLSDESFFFFLGDNMGLLEEGPKTYLMATNSLLNLPILFLYL
jgi:hypothetical protein